MRHKKKVKKLGLKKSHRESLIKNLVLSLVMHGRIKTIENRAKVLASRFDRVMNILQKKEKREFIRLLPSLCAKYAQPAELGKKFDELKTKYASRKSGFTRITCIGCRKGDNSKLVLIELI